MSEAYEEIVEGETLLRRAPGPRHEQICARLHERVTPGAKLVGTLRLLPPRTIVRISAGTFVRPDLALVAVATGRLWLAAEVINSDDHRTDTVTKKSIYEELNVPRLWMVDSRYNNVEIYQGTEYGLMLRGILAGSEILSEQLLPGFQYTINELFL